MSCGQLIAACGLDCNTCDLRLLPHDTAAAERVIAWFRDMGWLAEDEGLAQILDRSMYCQGCHGDRAIHWSADCWILQCCVDDRGHDYCFQCRAFPCAQLQERADGNPRYARALTRLWAIKRGEDISLA
jgi:hypothetical protein